MTDTLMTEQTNPTEFRTPGGLQIMAVLQWRRLFVALLVLGTCAVLAFASYKALGLGHGGFRPLESVIFLLSLVGLPWTVVGFWNAVIGFYLLHIHPNGIAVTAPFLRSADKTEPLSMRIAVVMTVRNEDPSRAMQRLLTMRTDLDATGQGGLFDYFVLSDTSDPETAAQEEKERDRWYARYGADARLTYRRRTVNEGFKAGNVRDFLDRYGGAYDVMLTLDADSIMSAETILLLSRIMEAHPKLGILQSLVIGTPSKSAFARVFQFGMRHGMRSYTMGSAWWTADCGPYWGHNAFVRIAPFREKCHLPVLPGEPPLGGPILSHDQIEAALMRRAGYEVRVMPIEQGSYEDNPPTLLDFIKRDLRWCQGNMQYWRLLGLPGLLPLSRVQIALAIQMYLGAAAWTLVIALSALNLVLGGFKHVDASLAVALFFTFYGMSLVPKLAGLADVLATKGGAARYGGTARLLAGGFIEAIFSLMLAPIMTLRLAIFMIGLPLGRTVLWNGQVRDAYGLSWHTALRAMWLPTVIGFVLLLLIWIFIPKALWFSLPVTAGLVLAIPLAVVSSSPTVGAAMVRFKLCSLPEEWEEPSSQPPLLATPADQNIHGATKGGNEAGIASQAHGNGTFGAEANSPSSEHQAPHTPVPTESVKQSFDAELPSHDHQSSKPNSSLL